MASKGDGGGGGGRTKPPQMSTQVLLHSLGLGEFAPVFQKAGFSMIEGNTKWNDQDVDDIIQAVADRSGETFNPDEKVALWKALRYMWHRGPGHDAPFIEQSEVPPLFLPKRDARQMDSEVKFPFLEPDRQRQIVRKKTLIPGRAGINLMQFEVYRRQKDIFYEMKDIQRSVAEWQKMNPRRMLREDPREEAMKVRIRRMLDSASDFLQDRHRDKTSLRYEGHFFFFCQLLLIGMAFLMWITAYKRYEMTPKLVFWEFFFSSKQFLAGMAYFLAFMVAFAVSDRQNADQLERRYQRMIVSLERLVEEISAFRVETDEFRMEEHEVIRQQISAAVGAAQAKAKKQGLTSHTGEPRKRKKKKKAPEGFVGFEDIANWAPNVKADSQAEFQLKVVKGIEESYKRLPPLPEGFRRDGGERMFKFQGALGGIEDETRNFTSSAALHVHRNEGQLAVGWAAKHGHIDATDVPALTFPNLPLPLRPPMPPAPGQPLSTASPSPLGSKSPAGLTPPGTGVGQMPFFGTADSGLSAMTPAAETPAGASDGHTSPADRTPAAAPPPFSLSDTTISLADSTPLRKASLGTWPSGDPVGGMPPPPPVVAGSTPRDSTPGVSDTSAERSQLRTAAADSGDVASPVVIQAEGAAETSPLRSAAGGAGGADAASLPPPAPAVLLPGELPESHGPSSTSDTTP